MKLLDILSHMPFMNGSDMYFCTSPGRIPYAVPQLGKPMYSVSLQTVYFQPWRLAVMRGERVDLLDVDGLVADTPSRLFCNPVVSGTRISFIYDRRLYLGRLYENRVVDLTILATNIYSGYVYDGQIVTTVKKDANENEALSINTHGKTVELATPFKHILRVIPHNGMFIVTGQMGDATLRTARMSSLGLAGWITDRATGNDVYKCCLDNWGHVIHAVKEGADFEDRYLHVSKVKYSS